MFEPVARGHPPHPSRRIQFEDVPREFQPCSGRVGGAWSGSATQALSSDVCQEHTQIDGRRAEKKNRTTSVRPLQQRYTNEWPLSGTASRSSMKLWQTH